MKIAITLSGHPGGQESTEKATHKRRTKMKLYHVHSTVEAFHGFTDVIITWFMLGRAQPLLPYEEAIQGYAEIDDKDKCHVEGRLDEHFTESEAQQVLAWLNQNRRGGQTRDRRGGEHAYRCAQ
jgi:hypothetical protein